MTRAIFTCCIVTITLIILANGESERFLRKPYTLKLVVSQPITGPIAPMRDMCLGPIQLAIDLVNNRSDILPDYNVVVDVIDDQCNPPVFVKNSIGPFFLKNQRVFENFNLSENWFGQFRVPNQIKVQSESAEIMYTPPIFGGTLCSGVCAIIGNFAKQFHHIHVSSIMKEDTLKMFLQFAGAGCNNAELDDYDQFPNTYRSWSVIQAADAFADYAELMKWDEVAVISDSFGLTISVN